MLIDLDLHALALEMFETGFVRWEIRGMTKDSNSEFQCAEQRSS